MFRLAALPPWTRAPFRLWSAPSLFVAVLVAAAVVGIAGGSRPLFVSSTGSAALAQSLREGCPYDAGLRVERRAAVAGATEVAGTPAVTATNASLNQAVGDVPGVEPPVTTLGGERVSVVGAANVQEFVQLVSRTGSEAHIDVLDEVAGPGIWLADTTAARIMAAPGTQVTLGIGAANVPVPVRGVFRDLSHVRRGPYWCSQEQLIEGYRNLVPPSVTLVDEPLLLQVLAAGGIAQTNAQWEYAPDADGLTVPRAQTAWQRLRRVASETNNESTDLGRMLGPGKASVDQQGSLSYAERSATTGSATVGPVALGTTVLALLMLIVAAHTWLDRRRQELSLLAMRGAGPGSLAIKGLLEMATPMVLGAALGLGVGALAVKYLGPSELIDGDEVASAFRIVGVALVLGCLAVVAVVLPGVRSPALRNPERTRVTRFLVWEPVVLVAAAAAYYELSTRGSSLVNRAGETEVDSLVLLFPVLLLLGGSGLLARLLLSGPPLRVLATRLPTAGWLGSRRLGANWFRAIPVVTGAAVSIGIVVFAGSLHASLSATIRAKTTLGPGAEQVVKLTQAAPVPVEHPLARQVSEVIRDTEDTVVERGHLPSDVLGIDPDTFERAAFWDPSFASRSLGSLVDDLRTDEVSGDTVPAIGVGDGLPDEFALTLNDSTGTPTSVHVRIVDRAEAFPGYGFNTDRPLVVVNRDVFQQNDVVGLPEVWLDNNDVDAGEQLRDAGLPVRLVVRNSDLVRGPLSPQFWSLDYIRFIGLVAAAVPLAALGLYFAVHSDRRRLGSALARKMGMARRTAVAASADEVGIMLGAGVLFGALGAWTAIFLIFDHLDPIPLSPPAALFRFDFGSVTQCCVGALLVTLLATILVERQSSRTSLPELLRHAT